MRPEPEPKCNSFYWVWNWPPPSTNNRRDECKGSLTSSTGSIRCGRGDLALGVVLAVARPGSESTVPERHLEMVSVSAVARPGSGSTVPERYLEMVSDRHVQVDSTDEQLWPSLIPWTWIDSLNRLAYLVIRSRTRSFLSTYRVLLPLCYGLLSLPFMSQTNRVDWRLVDCKGVKDSK